MQNSRVHSNYFSPCQASFVLFSSYDPISIDYKNTPTEAEYESSETSVNTKGNDNLGSGPILHWAYAFLGFFTSYQAKGQMNTLASSKSSSRGETGVSRFGYRGVRSYLLLASSAWEIPKKFTKRKSHGALSYFLHDCSTADSLKFWYSNMKYETMKKSFIVPQHTTSAAWLESQTCLGCTIMYQEWDVWNDQSWNPNLDIAKRYLEWKQFKQTRKS